MWIEHEVIGVGVRGGVVAALHGSIDNATVQAVQQQLDAVEATLTPPAVLVLDLSGISFLG